jgi:hypothetical protein
MPRAARLLGFDLGFLFMDDGKFESGVIQFNTSHPHLMQVCDRLRQNRMDWQSELSKFRNHYLEHRKADQSRFAKFYDPATAEKLFTSVWETMADLFPVFFESHFTSSISIERIPDSERDPNDYKRFRYVWRGAPPLG